MNQQPQETSNPAEPSSFAITEGRVDLTDNAAVRASYNRVQNDLRVNIEAPPGARIVVDVNDRSPFDYYWVPETGDDEEDDCQQST